MKKIAPIRVSKENWRAPITAILSFLLLSFSVYARADTPQNAADCGQAGELVTLNLRDVDIGVLIDTVAEISGKNIIIDSRVGATVTLVSSLALDSNQLYEVFLSVLEAHDLEVVDFERAIMVVPKDTIILESEIRNWNSVLPKGTKSI